MEKCKKCGQKNGVHKMGCETRKVTIMADITMCSGKDCPLKETCHRFTATKSIYQSYFMRPPIKKGDCLYYWLTEKKEEK